LSRWASSCWSARSCTPSPRTAGLGAILLTGYLGGAVATNLRVGAPLLLYILFPIYVAGFVWGGIYLREDRLREVVPVRG
jgi:hypothetical protein